MKKTYIAPSCKIRLVKKCNIIATSDPTTHDEVSTQSLLGRGWDDDDWDED